MSTKLGFFKLTALAAMCALGLGATQFARADGLDFGYQGNSQSGNGLSFGFGSGYSSDDYYGDNYYGDDDAFGGYGQ